MFPWKLEKQHSGLHACVPRKVATFCPKNKRVGLASGDVKGSNSAHCRSLLVDYGKGRWYIEFYVGIGMFKMVAKHKIFGIVALMCSASSTSFAQSPFASIPDALQGLYTLEMVNATSLSPIKNTDPANSSDDISLYVTGYGELCTKNKNSSAVDLLAGAPTLLNSSTGLVRWDVPALDLSFSLNINQIPFTGFDLQSNSGSIYGRLTGSAPVFDNGSCGSPPLNTSVVNTMFSSAESAYTTLFPSSSFSYNQIGSGYDVFRYYPKTDTYLAVRNQEVFARGGDFGGKFISVGKLTDILTSINNMLVPNRLPVFYQGTYLLSLTEAQPFSPLADGTALNFVVTKTGQLCVGELALSFPVVSGNTATWNNTNGNLRYTVDLTRDDDPTTYDENLATGEFTFQSQGGITYGLFTGDKTSLATECGAALGTDPDLSNINTLFSLIEKTYPTLFPKGPQTYNQQLDGYTYRYYFDSQIFIGVKSGVVYVNGGAFGNNLEPVAYGTLSNVLAQLSPAAIATVPASSRGTYNMSFASSTQFSPFSDGATAQVVMDALGNLCFDGVPLGKPTARQASPNIAFWDNASLGLSFSLDLSTLSATDMSLSVGSTTGIAFSTLSGNRTSLQSTCGGNVSTDLTLANQLFGLAEQYYANLFPASSLSFSQSNGVFISRYYPSTKMTLYVEGETVSVMGGTYGTSLVPVGQLSALIAQITKDNTPAAPIYDLRITGTGQVIMLNTSIPQKVDIKDYNLVLPDSTNNTALIDFVRKSFASTLIKIDSVSINSVVSTSTQLVFNASVSGATSTKTSTYDLVYTFSKR